MTLVSVVLKSDFKHILRGALPDADLFLYAMEELHAFVAGYAALAFFQRWKLDCSLPIEIFVPRTSFMDMMDHLQDLQGASVINTAIDPDVTASSVCVTSTVIGQGSVLLLHASVSEAPLLPVARLSNTALVCYVGAQHYGAVWPRLTLESRALVGDEAEQQESVQEALEKMGMESKLYAWMWPAYGPAQRCARAAFLCPAQPRFFTDRGSLRLAWEPLGDTGDMDCDVCFRIDGRPCDGPCLLRHMYLRSAWMRACVV